MAGLQGTQGTSGPLAAGGLSGKAAYTRQHAARNKRNTSVCPSTIPLLSGLPRGLERTQGTQPGRAQCLQLMVVPYMQIEEGQRQGQQKGSRNAVNKQIDDRAPLSRAELTASRGPWSPEPNDHNEIPRQPKPLSRRGVAHAPGGFCLSRPPGSSGSPSHQSLDKVWKGAKNSRGHG